MDESCLFALPVWISHVSHTKVLNLVVGSTLSLCICDCVCLRVCLHLCVTVREREWQCLCVFVCKCASVASHIYEPCPIWMSHVPWGVHEVDMIVQWSCYHVLHTFPCSQQGTWRDTWTRMAQLTLWSVLLHAYTHAHVHIHTHTHTHIHGHTHKHTHIYTHISTCRHAQTQI